MNTILNLLVPNWATGQLLIPERSQTFKFFEEYFTANTSDISTFVSLEALDVTERVEVGKIQARGGFADVYDGLLQQGLDRVHEPIKIAVKVFRTFVCHGGDNEV